MRYSDFLNICQQRLSCRSYTQQPVKNEDIKKCIECARLAPSACNKQPWRFIIVKNDAKRQELCDKALLPGLPMPWTKQAPVIVVLCLEKTFITHTLAPILSGVNYQLIDAGIAGEHFVLAAETLGLGTCWIGWFKEKSVKKILTLPKKLRVVSLFTLGYPDEKHLKKQPSSRKQIQEIMQTI